MAQSARESAQAMRDRVATAMQPGDNKSTVHSLPPDERESMLGLDHEEHPVEGSARGGQKQPGTAGRKMGGGGGPLDSVADTVTKAFGGKSK
ncbi:uncharacterized protein TRUGW13939_07153 [Talaromyces rugulosus]|uniref:Uncharacterized protein n=1 Tax=Talaromyces rugulosus TaxID=121627 RepID=A0A7H8R306_TALRU|nr:uncharacterized protein TRUGW13939_07153 [Talaromyces rugulosus]QKX60011.1 hypothetical protein TRUGW13939_07153 [Talaromyces rugulosus]